MLEWIAAQGGLIGLGVLGAKYSLLLFSALSLAVFAERLLVLRRLGRAETRDFPPLRDALVRRDFGDLHARLSTSAAPSAAVLRAGLAAQNEGEARLREVMELEMATQNALLQSNLPILATAATTAPYIGLFGTVLGILAAFREIAQSGQTGASIVAGGISEALTATALGLGVAIPSVMAYNYFTGRINKMGLEIESHSLEFAARLVAADAIEAAPQNLLNRPENRAVLNAGSNVGVSDAH